MFARQVEDLVEFGLYRNEKDYGDTYQDTAFQLYAKYTYEDVCRLLNWEKGEVALNIDGYKYDKKTKTYPVFINYDKQEDIADTIRYEDRFVSPDTLIAISKSGRFFTKFPSARTVTVPRSKRKVRTISPRRIFSR